jgi:hypothetical protein
METLDNLELKDESVFPDERVLQTALRKSFTAYRELLRIYDENAMNYEWRYYKDGKAWLCKVQYKKKTIVWMSAWEGFIKAGIYIPEKYTDKIYSLDISEETKNRIRETKNVGTSKPCIFEVRNKKDLKDFKKVMQFKLEMQAIKRPTAPSR